MEEEVSDLKESDMTGYYGFADHHKLEAEIQEMDNEGVGQTDGYCLTIKGSDGWSGVTFGVGHCIILEFFMLKL